MSFMIANAFVKDPVTGWSPVEWGTPVYRTFDDALYGFAAAGREGGYKILRSWQNRFVSDVSVFRLEMKTKHQLEHPEHNQAAWEAELTIVEV